MPSILPSVATFRASGATFPGDPERSPTEAVTFWLRRDIVRGVFEPLERLKIEHLAKFYRVGQSPVREAIGRVLGTGLISHEFLKGYRVAQVSLADYNDVLDIYQRLRRLALQMAVQRGTQAWEERVVVQMHRSMKVRPVPSDSDSEQRELWQRAYGDLQMELMRGCNSPSLIRVISDIGARLERYGNLFADLSTDLERDHAQEHRQMVDALIARDARQVEALLDTSGALSAPMRASIVEDLRSREQPNRRRGGKGKAGRVQAEPVSE